jgi:acyl carrier protein
MMVEGAESDIRSYIVKNFLFGVDDETLSSKESLFDRGVIDSTGVLEMVAFLDERFGVSVLDDELIPNNFDSIVKLTAFVNRKRAASPAHDIATQPPL